MTTDPVGLLVLGGVLSGGMAGFGLFVPSLLAGGRRILPDPVPGVAIALSGSVVACFAFLYGPIRFPPAEASRWFPFLLLAAAVAGTLEEALRLPSVRWGVRLVLSGLVPWLLLGRLLAGRPAGEVVAIAAGLGLSVLGIWTGIGGLGRRVPPRSLAFLLLLAFVGNTFALAISGSVTLGQQAGMCTGALAAATAVAWLLPGRPLAPGIAAFAAAGLAATLILGKFLSDLPLASAFLLAASPLAGWAGEIPAVHRRGPRAAAFIRAGAVLVFSWGGAAVAAWKSPPLDS